MSCVRNSTWSLFCRTNAEAYCSRETRVLTRYRYVRAMDVTKTRFAHKCRRGRGQLTVGMFWREEPDQRQRLLCYALFAEKACGRDQKRVLGVPEPALGENDVCVRPTLRTTKRARDLEKKMGRPHFPLRAPLRGKRPEN